MAGDTARDGQGEAVQESIFGGPDGPFRGKVAAFKGAVGAEGAGAELEDGED